MENARNIKNAAKQAKEHFEKTGIRTIIQIDEFDGFLPFESDNRFRAYMKDLQNIMLLFLQQQIIQRKLMILY